MNSKVKYQILVGSAVVDVFPINDDQLTYTYDRGDDDKIFYERKLKNKLMFGNDPNVTPTPITDFDFFYGYESNPNLRCSTFTLNIFKRCSNTWVLDWQGDFSLNDAEWDLDRCVVTIKAEPKTLYECVKRQKALEVNILDLPNIITTSASLDFNYEYYYCYGLPFFASCPLPGVQTATWTQAFQNLNHNLTYQCNNYNLAVRIYYREFVITACVGGTPQPPPGVGWALEQNNCAINQTAKYVRTPVAGPFPANQYAFGWWNYITNTQELPPEPIFKSVVVTNTPQSEDFLLDQAQVIFGFGGSPQPAITYHFEVLNNPNSTYVWSLNPGSPITATVSGTTNICNITPTNNASGTIQVLLTETHGNGYVSTKVYNVPQIVSPIIPGQSASTTGTIIGQTTCCPSQQNLFFRCTAPPTCSTGNPSVSWGVTGGTIVSGQGTDNILVNAPASGSFTVTAFWQISVSGAPGYTVSCTSSQVVTVKPIPESAVLLAISEVYPLEPNVTFSTLARSGSTFDVYRNTTSLGAATLFGVIAVYQAAAPGSVGTYCYLFKEHVNCGCSYVQIVPPTANGTVGMLPAVYWCPSNTNNIQYTRNRSFKEVVEYVIEQMGCGINAVVSDFFDWNAPGDTPGYASGVNYVLANMGFPVTTNMLTDITIAQKSDIISYNSSNPATKGLITFDKLEKIWLYMFNAYWFIDGTNLRIEHISYFNRTVAYNANSGNHAKYNVAKNKYVYDKSKMPKFEKFSCAEMMFTDFIGTSIYYDNLCVDQDSASNTKERILDFVTTDLYALYIDPANANKVGFVLMANDIIAGNYVVATEQGEISGSNVVNGHLSWANLHNNYHRHNRVLFNGYLNNNLTTFESVKPTKQQKDIVLQICCADTFDPLLQLYKTELGEGVLDSGEQNIQRGTIKMGLLHE